MFSVVSSHFSAVLIERVQAAHLQGQDDPDHQVWNQSYKSKYVVLKDEAGNVGNKETVGKGKCSSVLMLRQKPMHNSPAMKIVIQVFMFKPR